MNETKLTWICEEDEPSTHFGNLIVQKSYQIIFKVLFPCGYIWGIISNTRSMKQFIVQFKETETTSGGPIILSSSLNSITQFNYFEIIWAWETLLMVICYTMENIEQNYLNRLLKMSNKWMAFLPFIQLLLLLLSRFSRVQLCATPWTAAHQAPPSMGFSRQEYWSGVPLPSLSIYSAANIKRNYVPLSTLFSFFGYKVKNDKNPFLRGLSQLVMEDKHKNRSW